MRVMSLLMGVGLAALAASPGTAADETAADETAAIAKNLAENVLGKGLVRTSRVTDGGKSVVMVWETATYKPTNTQQFTRELLQTEAQFVAAAIFRVLTGVRALQFEIVRGRRSLCNGEYSRDRPPRITYAPELGP